MSGARNFRFHREKPADPRNGGLPGRVLRVSSHNPAYEPFDIHDTDGASRDFAVMGRVRWAGITFS